jgi:hypothetical protein
MVVQLANNVSLDFMEKAGPISVQHYAFLIGEGEFDATFSRIRGEGISYWADPGKSRPNEINPNDGGSGVYFEDPDGHVLEVITRPMEADENLVTAGGLAGTTRRFRDSGVQLRVISCVLI